MRNTRVLMIAALTTLAGCCSLNRYEDMRHRAEAAEGALEKQQMFTAGCQDDNGALQKALIEQSDETRRWMMGSMIQAKREAELREGCDI